MATFESGGPAFARPASMEESDTGSRPDQEGMSLRDYFAAHALTGVVQHWNKWAEENPEHEDMDRTQEHWERRCATESYRYADAMLEARKSK